MQTYKNIISKVILVGTIALSPLGILAEPNLIHPLFPLLDANGNQVQHSGGEVSTSKTCGGCHDTDYITKHSFHYNDKVRVDCVQCHFENGKIEWEPSHFNAKGELLREYLTIRSPENKNCNTCHGIIHQSISEPLEIPQNFFSLDKYMLTKRTGVIVSHQKLFESFLNLENKANLDYPWDIHADRRVECIDCHFSSNNPKKSLPKKTNELKHLKLDPRTSSIAEFLKKPNHELTTVDCSHCHDPLQTHDMLPYKAKHLERLACQSCHISTLNAPTLLEVDATTLNENKKPVLKYRNTDSLEEETINAGYVKSITPFLFPSQDSKQLKPFNLVTEWYWKEKDSNRISDELLEQVFSEIGQEEVLKYFDKDKNGEVESKEWILDTEEKVELIKNKLKSLGTKSPEIFGEIHAYPVSHGVVRGENVLRDCYACHSENSRIEKEIRLGYNLPTRPTPQFAKENTNFQFVTTIQKENDLFLAKRELGKANYYIMGYIKKSWVDVIGLTFLFLTMLGILIHGGYRIALSKNSHKHAGGTEKVYMYSFYERLWHWTSAFGIIILLITGLEVHFPGTIPMLNLTYAIYIHNILAFIVIVNAFLSLFYHLASSEIKQYLPPLRSFWNDTLAQINYYTKGIFKGEPHPLEKTKDKKLNPLQQITYLAILNVLLPLQVFTGLLMWGAERWPEVFEFMGGLSVLAPVHTLGSWMFLTFLIMHIYLTTTGHTWFSNIQAMMFGFEDVEKGNKS